MVAALGFHYPTRMAVARLADGGLFVWSPVALTAAVRRAIDALGPVAHLVAPNHLHHVFLTDWVQAYPEAQLWAPPGLARKRGDLTFDGELAGPTDAPWADDLEQGTVPGNRITTEVFFFHRPSKTVLVADLVQQLPPEFYAGWRAKVARLDLMTAEDPTVPRKFRMMFSDKTAARQAVDQILAWPCEQVAFAHGPLVFAHGQTVLTRAFDWLKP